MMRGQREPSGRWSQPDRLLALALTEYEQGLCSGCGQPRIRSINDDIDGYLVAHRYLCHGCKAAHDDVEAHGPLLPGQHVVVVDESEAGFEPDPRMLPKF